MAAKAAPARKCDSCGKTAKRHCAECEVCEPRDSEHPYWCGNAWRYGQ